MATATIALVLLCKTRCRSFFTAKTCLYALSAVFVPFSLFAQSFPVEASYILHALPSQTVLDFLLTTAQLTLPFYLGRYGYFLAGKDQQQTKQPTDQAGGQP